MSRYYEELKDVRVKSIARYVFTQPASFWLVCGYLFFEYVRPQQIYTVIDFLPWAQLLIVGTLAALVIEGRLPVPKTIAGGLLSLFTGIVLLSSFFAFQPGMAFLQLEVYLSWVLIFLLITTAINTPDRFFVFFLLFLLASFKMSQHAARSWAGAGFGFRDWGVAGAPGWFTNSGEFAVQMCVFVPMAWAFIWALKDRWSIWKFVFFLLFPITAVMGIVASSSRGGLVGLAAILAWALLFVSRRVKTLVGIALVAGLAWLIVPDAQRERIDTAGEDDTSVSRLVRWEDGIDIMNDNPVLGVGYENWTPYYRTFYPNRRSHGVPHNIFVEAGSELGYTGLITFLLMIFATFRLNHSTRRLVGGRPLRDRFLYAAAFGLDGALVGFMASGFFVTVLYYPFFWINLALTVSLHLASRKRRAQLIHESEGPHPSRSVVTGRQRVRPRSHQPAAVHRQFRPRHGLG